MFYNIIIQFINNSSLVTCGQLWFYTETSYWQKSKKGFGRRYSIRIDLHVSSCKLKFYLLQNVVKILCFVLKKTHFLQSVIHRPTHFYKTFIYIIYTFHIFSVLDQGFFHCYSISIDIHIYFIYVFPIEDTQSQGYPFKQELILGDFK